MELLSVFRSDNQRMYLTQLLPGMVALWPFAFLVIDGMKVPVSGSDVYLILVTSVYVFTALGIGVLLEDIGSLIELRLEALYFDLKSRKRSPLSEWNRGLNPWSIIMSMIRHSIAFLLIFVSWKPCREWLLGCHLNKHTFSSREEAHDQFYANWDSYLKLTFTEHEPVALRYYRAALIRFKFEINVSAAFLLMLGGHLVVKVRELGFRDIWNIFNLSDTWLYLALVGLTVSILIVEAFKMIELLDEIRYRLITISEKSASQIPSP